MSYQIALSALQAINSQLDTISQNIANTGTTGYKSSRTNFSAMYSSSAPNGVRASSTTQTLDMSGGLLSTGRNLDVAIAGKGYFMAKDGTGVMNYTRVGVFDVDKQGYVVDHMGRQVQGYAQQPGSSTLGALGELKVPTGQIPAKASSSVDFVGNLSADWVVPSVAFDPKDSSSYNSSTVSVVYDSLGSQHIVTQYFVKTANNEVTVHYQNENNAVGTSTLAFSTAGQLDLANSTLNPVALKPAGAEPLSVTFNYAGTTQFAGDTATTTNAPDGYASGTMVNVLVAADGSVNAQYSNGMMQSVGKIALATFASESGLASVDGTSWQATVKSGTALIGTPGTGQMGELASQQLEQSNVEVANELVGLMGAQRNYQANTKVISTQNEIMQSLMQVL